MPTDGSERPRPMVPDLRSASWPGSINILEARLDRRVLMVVGTKEGRYDKLIFRLAADFGSYDLRVVPECFLRKLPQTVNVMQSSKRRILERFDMTEALPPNCKTGSFFIFHLVISGENRISEF